jgi:tRNA nucleotidyltransferase (CCA-adding enzyme)
MNFEKSCGVVIYRKIGVNLEFLYISNRSDGHWGFPKGHVEENESEEETAIREVSEETRLRVDLIFGFRESVEYLVKENTKKEVVFFLARGDGQAIQIQLDEVSDYKWTDFQSSKQLLDYESSRLVLDKAYEFITL